MLHGSTTFQVTLHEKTDLKVCNRSKHDANLAL